MNRLFVSLMALAILFSCGEEPISPTRDEDELIDPVVVVTDPGDTTSTPNSGNDEDPVQQDTTIVSDNFNDNIHDYWILRYKTPDGNWQFFAMHIYQEDGKSLARILEVDMRVWRAISDGVYKVSWDGEQLQLTGDQPAEWFVNTLSHDSFGMISWRMNATFPDGREQLLFFDRGSRNIQSLEEWEEIIATWYSPVPCRQILEGIFSYDDGTTTLNVYLDTYKQDEGELDFYISYTRTFEDPMTPGLTNSNGTFYKGTYAINCDDVSITANACGSTGCLNPILPINYETEEVYPMQITITLPAGVFTAMNPFTGEQEPMEGNFVMDRQP